jgi:hypothetical protein
MQAWHTVPTRLAGLIEFRVWLRTGQPSMHVTHNPSRPINDVAGFPRLRPNFTPLARPSDPSVFWHGPPELVTTLQPTLIVQIVSPKGDKGPNGPKPPEFANETAQPKHI